LPGKPEPGTGDRVPLGGPSNVRGVLTVGLHPGAMPLAQADIGEDVLHALREALSNAARHGKAPRPEVTIAVGDELRLLVCDNGIGIGETSRRSGLANLARRGEQYGGTLTVAPAAGGGTELDWRAPLSASRP
jgi:signal transduction histidine kinase